MDFNPWIALIFRRPGWGECEAYGPGKLWHLPQEDTKRAAVTAG